MTVASVSTSALLSKGTNLRQRTARECARIEACERKNGKEEGRTKKKIKNNKNAQGVSDGRGEEVGLRGHLIHDFGCRNTSARKLLSSLPLSASLVSQRSFPVGNALVVVLPNPVGAEGTKREAERVNEKLT